MKHNSSKKKKDSPTHTPASLEDLQHEELSGEEPHGEATAASQTDEDEDEGVGDGNVGRSSEDPFVR
jgi:hypothetical protein